VADQFGFLDGAKGISSSLNASREVSKELSKSIADTQKEASDVAQQRNLDRRRELRENEVRKELFLKRVLIVWEHEEQVRREKQERELKKAFDSDLAKAKWAQFWCFAVAAWIAYFLVWGSK